LFLANTLTPGKDCVGTLIFWIRKNNAFGDNSIGGEAVRLHVHREI
jgi:hypothetical protein